MKPKIKSTLFFATLVITFIIYSNVGQDKVPQNELADNTIENALPQETLN